MHPKLVRLLLGLAIFVVSGISAGPPVMAQDFPTDDPVIKAIWNQGMEHSELYDLAQTLFDSIGPRLTGTPEQQAAVDWAVATLRGWGIEARKEQYGTWRGWRRGVSHVDLIAPRVRSLEGMMLAWSPATKGEKTGGVVMLPQVDGADAFRAWLPTARGKFVLLSPAEASCRPASSWKEHGVPGADSVFNQARRAARDAWNARIEAIGLDRQAIVNALEEAGATGLLTNYWTGAWGIDRIFSLAHAFQGGGAMSHRAAAFDLSCEDYGLVYRLTENNQGPRLRARADAEDLGELPVFNVIGTIPGAALPDEYVLLSAHYDSWDGASGTTDNGTGSVVMMEAMRILQAAYPNPKRTIIMGLWSSEEQGLNGSRAFAHDHPEVVDGLQLALNQDNGTGRVRAIAMQGLTGAGEFFARWLSRLPQSMVGNIDLSMPGNPGGGGSDYAAFICSGAPAFNLSATNYDYGSATWHTNRDTIDKIAWDDLKNNATITALLVYQAAEDSRIPRNRRVLGVNPRTGEQRTWPACEDGARQTMERFR